MAERLEDMIAEAERQRDEVAGFLRGLDDAQATRRPGDAVVPIQQADVVPKPAILTGSYGEAEFVA